jgi:hypothetical protein
VLKRVEVDDEGICVTVTLTRKNCAHTSGLTLIFEVRTRDAFYSSFLWASIS